MSFDTDVIKQGRGRAIRVDVSLDGFATIAYRYGDVAGELDGTNMYSSRVVEMGSVKRAFGNQHTAASSTTSLTLDNADGAIDWICGRENIADASKARFRVYVTIYEAGASPPTFVSKMLGDFILSSWPEHDNAVVRLQLADDFMGRLGTGLLLPTLRDWQGIGTSSTNPFFHDIGYPSSVSEDTPIQLAFGEDWALALPHLIPWKNNSAGSPYYDKIIVPLYSTTDLSAVDQGLVSSVLVEQLAFEQAGTMVQTVQRILNRTYFDQDTQADVTVFAVEKSPTITKGGLDFQIVYLVVRNDLGARIRTAAYQALIEPFRFQGDYPIDAVTTSLDDYVFAATVKKWFFKGTPLSQTVNPPSTFQSAHSIDVLTDLVSTYAGAPFDSASAARVKTGLPNASCAGMVQPWIKVANDPRATSVLPLSLRQEITKLAQSSDIDVFMNWAGEVSFSADIWDFTTSTQAASLLEIYETEVSDVLRWVPSNDERGAPFNRVNYEGGRASPVTGTGGPDDAPFQGPFDLDNADIPISFRVLEVVVEQGWNTYRQQRGLDPRSWRPLDGSARDRVRFRTHLGGLRLELGMYFKLTWSRGSQVGGPYPATTDNVPNTVFQCEAITYSPMDDVVEVEAIWRDDTQSERQYLLDDEDLLVRSKGALTGSATPVGGGTPELVNFDGTINLTTMGVDVGDILILRDSSQADDVFTRNGAWRISGLFSTTQVEVAQNGDGDYPASGASVINADWSIVRGKTTYPTVVSDPSNYPSGGDIYGKTTDTTGLTSDLEAGNRLISG